MVTLTGVAGGTKLTTSFTVQGAPKSAALFGAFPGPDRYPNSNPTQSKADMRAAVNARMGPIRVERIFNLGSFTVPPKGTPTVLCVDPPNIDTFATGANDPNLDPLLQGLRANGDVCYFTVLHEADNGKCTGPQLVAALKHIQARRDLAGATNVKIGPILMSYTLLSGGNWQSYQYAGMDFQGWDGYVRPNGPSTAHALLDPIVAAGKQYGVPLVIGELSIGKAGSGGGFTDAQWTQIVPDLISILSDPASNFAAVTWFETNKSDGDWRLANHPAALAAWKAAINPTS